MKLVSFLPFDNVMNDTEQQSPFQVEILSRYGWIDGDNVYDAVEVEAWCTEHNWVDRPLLPNTLLKCLEVGIEAMERLNTLKELVLNEQSNLAYPLSEIKLLSPLPIPRSVRDFYSFEQHVKTARAKRGLEMVPEWYHFPVFYFSNHHAVVRPDGIIHKPSASNALDFELEIACVIGKEGKNISPENALDHIAGFMIMNDWSARDIQREEVKVGLGPAKGKDFATSFGPYLLTTDELVDVLENDRHDLVMTASVNGIEYSRGNAKDIYWSFTDMIARASKDCWLYPGEVIGSGTVGTGCILELGTEKYPWLKSGDVVELTIEKLGTLRNTII